MRTLSLMATLGLFILAQSVMAGNQPGTDTPTYKYNYETVENDPLGAMIYTLPNGLKLYMSVNRDEPRVQTAIAVRAGSKNDPSETTGLAHYLEHMLFKGTSTIASTNWEKEKVLLQKISDLYEEHRNTDDPEKKKAIYKQIDETSFEAAKLAIPNEYDKMISSLGAKRTNAFTSYEQTVYINDIPATELEKWMSVESTRFQELVLRLFHTELETVYEEFNRGQDNDYRKVFAAMDQLLHEAHPYGTQTTIGTGEHLKNPSMVKIHEYFDTYYVPNNIAISLAGDLDPDATVDMVTKYFGSWESQPVPEFDSPEEKPITSPRERTVYGPRAEWVTIGFRFPGSHSEASQYVRLIDGILSNGQAGLIDLNLGKAQKVIQPRSYPSIKHDYSSLVLSGTPKEGQTMEEVRDLLLGQLELVKKGEFEDWMIDAVVKDFKLSEMRQYDRNWSRAFKMVTAFIQHKEWPDMIAETDELSKITKEQIMKFAQENFKDNYAIVYKKTGEDETIHKVEKPEITPIELNRNQQSEFAKKFDAMESSRLNPLFLDYDRDIQRAKLNNDVPFSYIENKSNSLFSLDYILDMGSYQDRTMEMAINYLPYLGTSKYTPEELTKEFFKLGVDFDVSATSSRIYVSLRGLEESMPEATKLFEHLLADAQPNPEALNEMVKDMIKERDDNKKEKYYIHNLAMMAYAKYGPKSLMSQVLSNDELKAMKAETLVTRLKELTSMEHQVFYYGSKPVDKVVGVLNAEHKTPGQLKPLTGLPDFVEQPITKNTVYFVNYDMVQTELLMISKGKQFDASLMPYASLYNEYFGAGLSSIIFQEIREAKALAYSAYSFFSSPRRMDRSHYVQAYVGTQTDKLGDAVEAMLELMSEMREVEDQFQGAKLAALKKIESERITRSSIFYDYLSAKERGLTSDQRKDAYEKIKGMELADLKQFFNENIKDRKYSFLVIGNREEVDFEALKKLGEVQELTLEEIFGY